MKTPMKPIGIAFIVLCCSCSSNPRPEETSSESLTVQDVLDECVVTDLQDLTGLLTLFQGLLDGGDDAPAPQFDIVSGLLSGGIVPWSLDLDRDGTPDLRGEIFFLDPSGKVTLPFSITDLLGAGLGDPAGLIADLLGDIPAGNTLHLRFEFDEALADGQGPTAGEGELAFAFGEEFISTVSGEGTFTSGECDFEFSFDDIGFDDVDPDGYPFADVGFEARVGGQSVLGSLSLDGTNVVRIRARMGDQPEEIFEIDLETGTLIE